MRGDVDLARAPIVVSPAASPRELLAARVLAEEVERRCGIAPRITADAPRAGEWHVALGTVDCPPPGISSRCLALFDDARSDCGTEAFVLGTEVDACRVVALSASEAGSLHAAGRLLRGLECAPGSAVLRPTPVRAHAPACPLRGHQLGWRPTSNTYDRWALPEFERYLRDLAAWGVNAIELIPFDDAYPRAENLAFTVRLADLVHSYGMQVWLWYPVDERGPESVTGEGLVPGKPACPSLPGGRRYLLARRRELFEAMRHVDGVFIPGGDPAGCPCERCAPWVDTLLPLARDVADALHERHPGAGLWLSNQGFARADNDRFYSFLQRERPRWLAGVVHGPWACDTAAAMRDRTPAEYPLRLYPDICHTVRCQYPARDWDQALASTLGREPPMYRAADHAHIARSQCALSCGAITYSDGVNDDLMKAVWSAVLWDPDVRVADVLADYARLHLPGVPVADVVQGIELLDRSWQAPLAGNPHVQQALEAWERIEAAAQGTRGNWRGQMATMTARYGSYVRRKQAADLGAEADLRRALDAASRAADPCLAARAALEATAAPRNDGLDGQRRTLLDHGQSLYDLIGMQLSVARWGASGGERGAILDYLDVDLSNVPWMVSELGPALELADPEAARGAIRCVLDWEDPGPGGFFDDLGDPVRQSHLVREVVWDDDPGSLSSPRCDFRRAEPDSTLRQSWRHYTETLHGTPVVLRYEGLDPRAAYAVRATYSGRYRASLVLTAGVDNTLHGPVDIAGEPVTVEYDVPRAAYAGGTLKLTWTRTEGRGVQVSEVWLLRRG